MFVAEGRVAVTAHGVIDEKDLTPETDVMFIRPKMTFGVQQRVIGSAMKLSGLAGGRRKTARAAAPEMQYDVGAYQVALMTHNVLAWQGPSFAGVACTAQNIARLDPAEPLVKRTLQEIVERNTTDEGEDEDEGNDPNP
jgi:hypothetical protein